MDSAADTKKLIAGAGAVVFFAGYLLLRKGLKKKAGRAAQAARVFRHKVLAELEGLYPVPRSWNDKAY